MLQQLRIKVLFPIIFALIINACSDNSPGINSSLEEEFINPSDESKPWVYWYWMRSNATFNGITRDLEAMAEVGIGGAYLMPIGNSAALDSGEKLTLAFRVSDRIPEFWDAATDNIIDAGIWHQEKNRTFVQIDMSPGGSVFVVFRRKANYDPVAKITSLSSSSEDIKQGSIWIQDGILWASVNGAWELTNQSGKTETFLLQDLPAPMEISGNWKVSFPPGRGAPEQVELKLKSLSENDQDGIRYFSGTATYEKRFEWNESGENTRLFLDLGEVANLAEVTLNGTKLAVLWTSPFVVEVTDAVKNGINDLSIAVTNTWHNRLTGDADLPQEKRISWLLFNNVRPPSGSELEPSGLIGPVKLITAKKAMAN